MLFAETPPAGGGAHPLLYASLTAIDTSSTVPRIDLYKPKALYSIGRNPKSDIVLDSQRLDWSLCTLQWDGQDEVRIVDLFSTNGIWVNRRRIPAGGSRVLQDGDTIFFSLCRLKDMRTEATPSPLCYQSGGNFPYTYHQYTNRAPPLSPADQSVWTRLDEAERSRRRIEGELERLRREREVVLKEQQSIIAELPEPPPFVRSDLAKHLQRTCDDWANIRKRQHSSVILPEDFRELCRPNTDDVACDMMWRERYQTIKYEQPPPLDWDAQVGGLSDAYHCSGWPDWNHPDIVWGGHQPLDQSSPLTVPPSIIYWSAKYKLPVYAHPRFDPDSTRIYARPYAESMDGFSDFSAARQRQNLGLPPLEVPPIVRPRKVLYSLDGDRCPDEDVLARKVASLLPSLRPDDELLPEPDPDRPKNMRDVLEHLKGSRYFISDTDSKRKRALDDDSDDYESLVSPSPPLRRSPAIKDVARRSTSVSSTKRRKLSASPPLHVHVEAPSASSSEGASAAKALSGSGHPSTLLEARASSPRDDA